MSRLNSRRTLPFALAEEPFIPLPPLPANHFLAIRPIEPPSPPSVITQRYWSSRARPDTSSLAAADYDVSVLTGFLPPDEPIRSLNLQGWKEFENLLIKAQIEVKGLSDGGVGKISEEWRSEIRNLPKPSTSLLTTLPLFRRAHVLLSFLGHFYIHSTFPALKSLPSNISIPWIEVSDKLGIPPILTYADTVLWNWNLIDPSKGIIASNMEITTTFTSSPSERAFFLLSLLCELHAPILLRLMSATLDEAFFSDSLALPRISSYLIQISTIVDELTKIMINACKGSFGTENQESTIIPECFYWEIRPWFNGGKWNYEGVDSDGNDLEMEWGGPSAGQSSLVHALDVFLSVDHSPRPSPTASSSNSSGFKIPNSTISLSSTTTTDDSDSISSASSLSSSTAPSLSVSTTSPSSSESSEASEASDLLSPLAPSTILMKPTTTSSPLSNDATFMVRASQYMPSHHRSFLQHLSQLHLPSRLNPSPIRSVRDLALDSTNALVEGGEGTEISKAYDTAIKSMKRFRDGHMRLVTVFIIAVSKKEPRRDSIFWEEWKEKRLVAKEERRQANEKLNKSAADVEGGEIEKLVGTGGTELVGFLKLCRERTVEALVG